jgi:gas vesicle protein
MNSVKVLLGVLAGLAGGAILGILFAPKKGRVTRKKLIRKGEYVKGTMKDKFDEYLNQVSEKFEDVKKEVF